MYLPARTIAKRVYIFLDVTVLLRYLWYLFCCYVDLYCDATYGIYNYSSTCSYVS
jgi:hypothetical protein